MDEKRTIANAVIVVNEEIGGAVIGVCDFETMGETFTSLGMDEDGAFLEGPLGRRYLDEANTDAVLLALEETVLVVRELNREGSFRQYRIDPVVAAPSMGL